MAHQAPRHHNQPNDPLTKGTSEGSPKRNIIRKTNGGERTMKDRALDINIDSDFQTGVDDPNDPNYEPEMIPIYHMCDEADFDAQTKVGLYYPPTYEQDNFIHATEQPNDLLNVGNHFYKEVKGTWICIKIDPTELKVIYEAPAPVGDKEAHTKGNNNAPLFPHVYGGLPASCILERYVIVRGSDGSFDEITGLI